MMFWVFLAVLALPSAFPSSLHQRTGSFSLPLVGNDQWSRNGPAEYAWAHKKYKVDLPEGFSKLGAADGGSGSVPAWNQTYDREYLSPVLLGTPGQLAYLDLDTGSADLWTFSSDTPALSLRGQKIYSPKNSTTSEKVHNASWSISYGDGSYASGGIYRDTIALGSVTIPNATVQSATTVSRGMTKDNAMSGILGLCYNHSSTVFPKQPTVLDQLGSILDKNLFGVDLRYHAQGQYDFGKLNESAYTGDIHWQPVIPGSRYWQVFLNGMHFGGTNVWYMHAWPMVVDTGTTLILLPEEMSAKYWKEVPSATQSGYYGGWVYDCNATLPDFEWKFGEDFGGVVPGAYLNFQNVSDTLCYGGIQDAFPSTPFGILGDIWLKTLYTVFDVDGGRVGVAKKDL